MKDGAILCNSGHFDVEIDIAYLNDSAKQIDRNVTNHVDGYVLANGHTLYILGQGRLVNLACAEGHPAQVMDMSFATQALAARWTATIDPLPVTVHNVPQEIDDEVASLKLAAMGIKIDALIGRAEEVSDELGNRHLIRGTRFGLHIHKLISRKRADVSEMPARFTVKDKRWKGATPGGSRTTAGRAPGVSELRTQER